MIKARAIWLLDLDFGGGVLRFAEEPVEITSSPLGSVRYAGGLDVQSPERSSTSAAARVLGPDWAQLAAEIDLESGRATLRRWRVGQSLESAEVWLVGRVEGPEWGAVEEGLELTVSADVESAEALLPAATSRICAETWPVQAAPFAVPEASRDRSYPIAVGYPGFLGFDSPTATEPRLSITACGCPAYLVEYAEGAVNSLTSKLLLAGHEIAATQVWVFNASSGDRVQRSVQVATDKLGRVVSYVDFNGSALPVWPEHEYWWACASGGGAWNGDRSGPLRGAGEVLVELLGDGRRLSGGVRSGVALDRGRQEAQRAYLDRFALDFALWSPVSAQEWVRAHLAPILPISWVPTRLGGYWLAWRWDATAADATARLDADAGAVRRASKLRPPQGDRFSRFRLNYGRAAQGSYLGWMVFTGDPVPTTPRTRTSYRCEIAQARERRRTGGDGVVEWFAESDVIQDDATAQLVLQVLSARYATPPLGVAYEGGPGLESLQLGDVVLVQDAEVGLHERVALVQDVSPGDVVRVSLALLSDPPRVRRSAT